MTGVPEDEADYVALLGHTQSCLQCNAFGQCKVGDELRAAVRRSETPAPESAARP